MSAIQPDRQIPRNSLIKLKETTELYNSNNPNFRVANDLITHMRDAFQTCDLQEDELSFLIANRMQVHGWHVAIIKKYMTEALIINDRNKPSCKCREWVKAHAEMLELVKLGHRVSDVHTKKNFDCDTFILEYSKNKYVPKSNAWIKQQWINKFDTELWSTSAIANFIIAVRNDTVFSHLYYLDHIYGWVNNGQSTAAKLLNVYHATVRATNTAWGVPLDDHHYKLLQYFGELTGRGDWDIDIIGELRDRLTPSAEHTLTGVNKHMRVKNYIREAVNEFYTGTCREDTALRNSNRVIPTFRQFLRVSHKWIASGSAPGHKWSLQVSEKLYKLALNKRFAIANLEEEYLVEILHSPEFAVLWSRSALKYELRKRRALWNSAVEHYLISSYLANIIEWHGYKPKWALGYQPLSYKLFNIMQLSTSLSDNNETLPIMFDFADFNINEENDEVATCWDEIGKCILKDCVDPQAASDVEFARQWLINATYNTYMEDQESGMIIKSVRGLITGSRATSLINTLNNRAYSLMTVDAITTEWNIPRYPQKYEMMLHHGDDVASILRTVISMLFPLYMLLLGRAGQKIKQLAILGRAEFLRYAITDRSASMFPMRQIATVTTGELVPNATTNDYKNRAISIWQTINMIKRKTGYDLTDIGYKMINKMATIYNYEGKFKIHKFPKKMVNQLSILGGGGYAVNVDELLEALSGHGKVKNIQRTDDDGVNYKFKYDIQATGPWSIKLRSLTPYKQLYNLTSSRLYSDLRLSKGYEGTVVMDMLDAEIASELGNSLPSVIIKKALSDLAVDRDEYLRSKIDKPIDSGMERFIKTRTLDISALLLTHSDLKFAKTFSKRFSAMKTLLDYQQFEGEWNLTKPGAANYWYSSDYFMSRLEISLFIDEVLPPNHLPNSHRLEPEIMQNMYEYYLMFKKCNNDYKDVLRRYVMDNINVDLSTNAVKNLTLVSLIAPFVLSYVVNAYMNRIKAQDVALKILRLIDYIVVNINFNKSSMINEYNLI